MTAPAPLTPPDCDLRGLPYMPLDVIRLGDSDLFALSTGDEFKAAVVLWCKSWVQVPAGSLPADDRILAHLSGTGPSWKAIKDMALRGWVLCSDGRLYHPVVAEKACIAWKQRQTQRDKAAKRWGKDGGSDAPPSPGTPPASLPPSPGNAAASTKASRGIPPADAEIGENSEKTPKTAVKVVRDAQNDAAAYDLPCHSNVIPMQGKRKSKSKEVRLPPSGAADRPLDAKTRLFGDGLFTLHSMTGIHVKQCRSIIGRWLRDLNNDASLVMSLIEQASEQRLIQPIDWLMKAVLNLSRKETAATLDRTWGLPSFASAEALAAVNDA